MRATTLLAQLALLVAAGTVPAGQEYPCRSEVERLCPGVEPGEGRIRACMRTHRLELSPDCRARLEEKLALRLETGARILLACKEDLEALCRSVPPGDGRWRRCLGEHPDQLSSSCRQLLDLGP